MLEPTAERVMNASEIPEFDFDQRSQPSDASASKPPAGAAYPALSRTPRKNGASGRMADAEWQGRFSAASLPTLGLRRDQRGLRGKQARQQLLIGFKLWQMAVVSRYGVRHASPLWDGQAISEKMVSNAMLAPLRRLAERDAPGTVWSRMLQLRCGAAMLARLRRFGRPL